MKCFLTWASEWNKNIRLDSCIYLKEKYIKMFLVNQNIYFERHFELVHLELHYYLQAGFAVDLHHRQLCCCYCRFEQVYSDQGFDQDFDQDFQLPWVTHFYVSFSVQLSNQ